MHVLFRLWILLSLFSVVTYGCGQDPLEYQDTRERGPRARPQPETPETMPPVPNPTTLPESAEKAEPNGTVETEDLLMPSAMTLGQLRSFLLTESPEDSPFRQDRDTDLQDIDDLLQGIEQARTASGLNPAFILALAIHESGWGRSEIAREKNNLFGYGAVDSDPYGQAVPFESFSDSCVQVMARIRADYLEPDGSFFNGYHLKGINTRYASDKQWAVKVRRHMNRILAHTSTLSMW